MTDSASSPVVRCAWANPANPRYLAYHDEEWGQPCHDEVRLFEMLNLEGAQAGLSWETILNKRENYWRAFDGWNAKKIARYDESKVASLLADAGIVRNRLKVAAAITNAQAYLKLQAELGGLDAYLWAFVDGEPIQNQWTLLGGNPAKTPLSDRISKDLAKRGFKFVGSTIIYAYMQAIGMVNDHCVECYRHHAVQK
ncbi:DNA-3-methyladenine glycosylase [Collimonas arenae]|uniref:DNA-3-methyladenine glycosylase n=1 Tax=Collimonas arenae TaxID=279058 RepID=A0A0A1FJU8_9BURK|nr:DNA-3-methyladenine glycosylase I [Collimonas arenae]AIY43939.1 DNA-3-methyladenine glycosylase [Collimonas arenae]